ncbi:MAG: class I SAM-dependent methyltransferase [Chthoniobacterales bacterium]
MCDKVDETTAIFREQWAMYRKVVDSDQMSHRLFYHALRGLLAERSGGFSLLELGCGDAGCSSEVLAGLAVSEYTGVDLAGGALELAGVNLKAVGIAGKLVEADFREFVATTTERWDVVFIGFSYHHLIGEEKVEFARQVHGVLKPGGELVFVEPLLADRETRGDYLLRWRKHFERDWTGFTEAERVSIWNHVSGYDYPESLDRYLAIGEVAGYDERNCQVIDPKNFYGMIRLGLAGG